jgi:hypothetical protein
MKSRDVIFEIPQGLGDAVYCYPILKELITKQYKGRGVYIYRNPYTLLFEPLREFGNILDKPTPDSVKLQIHYKKRHSENTTQYEDLVISAGLPYPPHFVFDWDRDFTERFKKGSGLKIKTPYLIVKEPCAAHMHKRHNMVSVDPDAKEMQDYINFYRKDYFVISVGHQEKFSRRLENIDLYLIDLLSLQDYITLVKYASVILTQVGHLVPLAQAFRTYHKIFYPMANTFSYLRPEKFDILFSKNYNWKGANADN